MSAESLAALRTRVVEDPLLARRLRRVDPDHFCAEVIRAADELGLNVTAADVDGAIAQAVQAWTLRWIS